MPLKDYTRRDFMKSIGWVSTSLALTGCEGVIEQITPKVPPRKPNIIFIMADDLGYGDLGCYGQKITETPCLDKMAAEGMRFTQHYAGSTVCAPSRCSLMTGLHTGHCQIRGNKEVKPEGQSPMAPGTVTIPTLLKKAGYTSGMFGKWGLGVPGSVSDPMEFFDEFYGYNCQREAHTYYPKHLWHNLQRVELDGKTYSHDLIMAAAKKFITVNKDKPFFCYMPITIPHAAMHAPKALHDKYRKMFPQFENKIGRYTGPEVQNPIAAFSAMVEHLDNGVGEVLELLKNLAIDNNTLVIFTSDNGPHMEGGHDPKFFNSNGPLKGYKRDLYEGGIRVPMIAWWPGTIKAGSLSNHISAFWDILPTFVQLARLDPPEQTDGISMVPTLTAQSKQQQHEYMYWEFYEGGGRQAVRMGNWKALRLNVNKNPDGPVKLYDLVTDLGENNNIAERHPEIVDKAQRIMAQAHTKSAQWSF